MFSCAVSQNSHKCIITLVTFTPHITQKPQVDKERKRKSCRFFVTSNFKVLRCFLCRVCLWSKFVRQGRVSAVVELLYLLWRLLHPVWFVLLPACLAASQSGREVWCFVKSLTGCASETILKPRYVSSLPCKTRVDWRREAISAEQLSDHGLVALPLDEGALSDWRRQGFGQPA